MYIIVIFLYLTNNILFFLIHKIITYFYVFYINFYWKIKFKSKAEKQLNNLDKQSKQKIQTYLNERILKLNHPKESGKALSRNKKGL